METDDKVKGFRLSLCPLHPQTFQVALLLQLCGLIWLNREDIYDIIMDEEDRQAEPTSV